MIKIYKAVSALICVVFLVSCSFSGTSEETLSELSKTESTERYTDFEQATDGTTVFETSAEIDTQKNTEEANVTELPNTSTPSAKKYEPRALMYHLIRDDVYGPYEKLFVRPSDFEAQLEYLDGAGYEYIFAEEWRLTEKPSVIITLDDGYDDNYTEMFPILKAHGARATVFLVSSLVDTDGYLTSDMIREMASSGLVSFQCHTANHVDLRYQSEDGIRSEFDESCKIIEKLSGKPVRAAAYPAGAYNDTVLAVTKEYFDFAYTTRSPSTTSEYTPLTVPRHYISRSLALESFEAMVAY